MKGSSLSTHRTLLAASAVALALVLGACSSDDAAADDPAGDAGSTNTESTESAGETSDGKTIEVVAVDYAYEDLPDTIETGTTLTLRNDAENELHELVAFRLPDDETRSVEEIVALSPEEMQAALGAEPTTVILAPPMSEQVATPIGDGTLEEPGRYAIICLIPTGADADEYMKAAATSDGPPDVPGGAPHIAQGMYAEVEVR